MFSFSYCPRFTDKTSQGALALRDLSLQYSIELSMNGMVDSDHSLTTLPVSVRMQRLRHYSSDFSSGAFHRQDLTAHPDAIFLDGHEE
ncbi:hypothetical protein GSI_02719 [Ganoderma sinense ZZ0214-1]|uniref:Uncharacterized protein n=1 Tax=Ganoderma sinense ZZ0214-1 TaxID=1077348 RepID=A0A2G8SME3_9APHY|nr:hypothetical protein GSI_02719 [Ganoderma sinense ZZ0214-1]